MSIRKEIELLSQICKGVGANIGCGDVSIGTSIGVDVSRNAKVASIHVDDFRLPFSDNSLDYIVSSNTLEHIKQAPILVLREWARCIKLGGEVGIVVPDAEYGIWSMTGDKGKCGKFTKKCCFMEHLHAFTLTTLGVLLPFAGFSIISLRKINREPVRPETTLFVRAYKNTTYESNVDTK